MWHRHNPVTFAFVWRVLRKKHLSKFAGYVNSNPIWLGGMKIYCKQKMIFAAVKSRKDAHAAYLWVRCSGTAIMNNAIWTIA
jgi:hypothetical protein